MTIRWQCVTVDSHDPRGDADFWQEVLGWRRTYDEPHEVILEPPLGSPEAGVSPDLLFIRVPESKSLKNRLHLDLRPDHQEAELERLIGLGATPVDIGQRGTESWVVLADPVGNEFCLLRSLEPTDSIYEG